MQRHAFVEFLAVGTSAVLISVLLASAASATATYEYAGSPFVNITDGIPLPEGTWTTSDSIAGSFQVASPIAPGQSLADISGLLLSFSFQDGRLTPWTEGNSTVEYFEVGTDAGGDIVSWRISLSRGGPTATLPLGGQFEQLSTVSTSFQADLVRLTECTNSDGFTCFDTAIDSASVIGGGAWTVVPEPGTAALFALGLAGLGVRARRRR